MFPVSLKEGRWLGLQTSHFPIHQDSSTLKYWNLSKISFEQGDDNHHFTDAKTEIQSSEVISLQLTQVSDEVKIRSQASSLLRSRV